MEAWITYGKPIGEERTDKYKLQTMLILREHNNQVGVNGLTIAIVEPSDISWDMLVYFLKDKLQSTRTYLKTY